MKKLFTFLLVLATNMTTMLASTKIGDLYYNLDATNKMAEVTWGGNYSGNISIPETVEYGSETYCVTGIGYFAFSGCTSLISVTIPHSITHIGYDAFKDCSNLISVNIPDGVTSIESATFDGCSSLNSITIPNSVIYIGEAAFEDCSSLKSITIPSSVTIIKNSAFYNCENLVSVELSDGLEEIKEWAFAECKNLTSINIPSSVSLIKELAFSYCVSLLSLTLPDGIYIESRAFEGVPNVICNPSYNSEYWGARSVNGYVEGYLVYNNASKTKFLACSPLQSGDVTVPNSVKIIGAGAFMECKKLTNITLGDNVTNIESGAFSGCEDLNSITIGKNVANIYENAFTGVNIQKFIWKAKTAILHFYEGNHYSHPFYESHIRNFTIGEYVDSLPRLSYGFESLDTVFWNAINLTKIPEGTLASPIVTPICEHTYNIGNIRFGNKVESIPPYLCHNSKIKSVNIPDNVKTIGANAFSDCSKLTKVIIGNGVETIGDGAFSFCTDLSSVTIGSGVTSIGKDVFIEDWDLGSITCYAENPPFYDPSTEWRYYVNTVYVPSESVSAYKAAEGWKEHTILPIGATPTTTTGIKITPSDYSADITWTAVSGATIYELVIKDKFGNVVCKVVFDSDGLLISIAFYAPSRDGAPRQTQSAGFTYTVMGLESGTEYNASITAKNAGGTTLNVQTISFITNGLTDISNTEVSSKPTKLLRNGQLLIQSGDHTYTLTGAEVK